jgi:exodeoxyribonuclease V alpha subunit
LETVFRQARRSLIVTNAHRIRRGEMPWLKREDPKADFYFIERRRPEEIQETILHVVTRRIPRGFGLDPRRDIQVLAPMRRGVLGTENLNLELQARLNPGTGAGRLRPGDRVMQIRNNYDLEVFNGEVGTIERMDADAGRVRVKFEGRALDYERQDLEELRLSYACSVHKSQGSEYPAVVMPVHSQHFIMLQRNLLYTAVTRGKRLVVLIGDRRALALAVRNDRPQDRYTMLAERLRED